MKNAQKPVSEIIKDIHIPPILSGSVFFIVFVIILILLGMDSYYKIEEQEQAILTTFGKATAVTQSGLHFKIPIIQKVQKVDTTIKGFTIGYDEKSNTSNEDESLMITNDYNFVNVDFYITYKISDPIKAIYASQKPELILKNIAQGCIRTSIGSYDVDSVLTTGKTQIQSGIRSAITKKLDDYDIGLQLINIEIQDSSPPTREVMEAFKAVETAKQGRETAINNANKYRNVKLPEAEAEIDQILQEAESEKSRRINAANAQVARFNATYEEYIKNPKMTRERMFYESMEDILPKLKIIIDGSDNTNKILPLDSFTTNNGGN